MALVGLSSHCLGDPRWKKRMADLKRTIGAVDFAELLEEAVEIQRRLLAEAAA